MTKDILFLAHRVPFPPDRGDRIRGYHLIRYLAQRARVHLVAFADSVEEASPGQPFTDLLASWTIVPRTKSRVRAAGGGLRQRKPLSLTAFAHPEISAAAENVLARHPKAATYVFSGQMAQYLPACGLRIVDLVDRDSAKFAGYADAARGPKAWLLRREARLLGAFEEAVAGQVDATLLVSAAEAALLPAPRVHAIENGIDARRFDPAAAFRPVAVQGPLAVFTGQMDYPPNVEAVRWFAEEVLPKLPHLRFAIVGRAPTAAVRALAGERVIVSGEVPDVRGWLAAADVVVAPLRLARGIQNKVLEAMAMARPVVASAAAAEGIDHAGTIRVGEDAAAIAGEVRALLDDQALAGALGQAARRQVIRRYDWNARLAPLDALLGFETTTQAAA